VDSAKAPRAKVGAQAARAGDLRSVPGARQRPQASLGSTAAAPKGARPAATAPEGPASEGASARRVHADIRRHPFGAGTLAAGSAASVHASAATRATNFWGANERGERDIGPRARRSTTPTAGRATAAAADDPFEPMVGPTAGGPPAVCIGVSHPDAGGQYQPATGRVRDARPAGAERFYQDYWSRGPSTLGCPSTAACRPASGSRTTSSVSPG